MEGGEQTTISPEFLENIQSAVNSQGVLGQVQVIETENGPVTVLFMEEGADTQNLGGENITLSVGDNVESLGETVVEDSGVQYQYHTVQADEDYSHLLQGAVGDTVVSVTDPVKEDIATTIQPVIDLPAADQTTIETYEQPIGDTTTTDTYYITDTGEILKIDSSLLGENAGDATLQLQTQDGTLQILNQIGNVETSQVDTQLTYPQTAVDNINITYDQGAPFEYTATKVDNPLVIDTARVEEPKVLSYKTTNRQRTNIMRQPAPRSTSTTIIQPKSSIASQSVRTQTSLLAPQYRTVKPRELSGTTSEVVYPQTYQKKTIVFPKVQKQTVYPNITKTVQQNYQTKLKTPPQQMITTVMKPQSLLKPNLSQTVESGAVVSKLGASSVPGVKVNSSSTYTQKQVQPVNKLQTTVVVSQAPAATKQTDLLSVAMKQAEVPQQVLSSMAAMQKVEASSSDVKGPEVVTENIEKLASDDLGGKDFQELVTAEALKDIMPVAVAPTLAKTVPEMQPTTEQQQTISPTTAEEKAVSQENSVVTQTEELVDNQMETDEQPGDADKPNLDLDAQESQTIYKAEKAVPETSIKKVAISRFSEKGCQYNWGDKVKNEKETGENGDVEVTLVEMWDKNDKKFLYKYSKYYIR